MSDYSHLSAKDLRIKRLLANTAAPESYSVIEAMRNLENEVRAEYDVQEKPWGKPTPITSPFDVPFYCSRKLHLEDVLALLRTHLNTSYMPSANGDVKFNSKPEYLVENQYGVRRNCGNEKFPEFPNAALVGSFCTISLEDRKKDELFAYIGDDKVEVVVNLKTLEAIVRIQDGGEWMEWLSNEKGGKPIAFYASKLLEVVQTYL